MSLGKEEQPDSRLDAWIRGLPKAEVHCHFEGCVQADIVCRAAKRQGVELPWATRGDRGSAARSAPTEGPPVNSLTDLLEYLDVSCALLDQADELAAVAYAASRHVSASGVRYLEVIITPFHWLAWRGRLGAMVEAIDAGFAQAESDGLTECRLCLSVSRRQTASEALELVDWMLATRHPRVVALSIDGNERDGSHNERFAEAFASAAAGGFHRCAHAGESSGPTGVREAIELLGAERIDHGIRAIEDPALVSELARKEVPLDVCPSSNRILGLTPDPARHPIGTLFEAGVRVSLNTDDPIIYGIHLSGEYRGTAATFGWGQHELAAIAKTSIESSFADPARKQELLGELRRYVGNDERPAPQRDVMS